MKIAGRSISLRKIRLDRGGYDSSGRYYGTGLPLYEAYDEETGLDVRFRAHDRDDAKAKIERAADTHWGVEQGFGYLHSHGDVPIQYTKGYRK